MQRRVVITGMGCWSCIGTTIEEIRESLYTGKSGIGIDETRKPYGYRSALTGIVPKPKLKGLLDRRQRTNMGEPAEYAFMATKQAFEMAEMNAEYLAENEVGCIFGNDSTAEAVVEGANIMAEKHDSELIGSGSIFQAMNSTVNMNLCSIFNLRGINLTVSSACASGSHSIGLGHLLIKQGLQDIVLCGGAQETNKYSMSSFDALRTFSMQMDEPAKASRPFDANRDGLIPSGGAAALVLEDYDHAVARSAHIIAEVAGYGFSSNGIGGISQPSDKGSALAMQRAMADAGVKAEEIDYINAHATSTPQGDIFEAKAIASLFKKYNTLVSSTKSMTGHECWMAGASEIIYSLIMMQNNFVAPNINFETPDEYSKELNITNKTIERELKCILSNSFGFGGTNSALVIKKI